jgi:AraC-like DNA-binding protein
MLQPIPFNFLTDIQTVPPSYAMKHFHEHERWELFFVVSGICTVHLDDEIYRADSGSLIMIPAGSSHKVIYMSGSRHTRCLLYFDTSELDWVMEQVPEASKILHHQHFVIHVPAKRMGFIQDLLEKITYENGGVDMLSHAFNRSYFHELILFLLRCELYKENTIQRMDVSNRIIQQVIEYILSSYSSDITLAGTARLFHMSESSLSKKFKAFTGYRFREYLVDVRTHAAADALLNSTGSITEIAAQFGFSDSNTFGCTFKRVFGVSPSNYRKRC